MYAELVVGLGETLVSGNYPGRALAFTWKKSGKIKPEIVSYPSKNEALNGEGVIARSDSNGEDLEKFAGAGLYDSMLLTPPRRRVIDYAREQIIHDESFRGTVMERIGKIGLAVEQAFGGEPQDIEGAFAAGKFYVVQSRTQV